MAYASFGLAKLPSVWPKPVEHQSRHVSRSPRHKKSTKNVAVECARQRDTR